MLQNSRLWIKALLIFFAVLMVFGISIWPTVYDYKYLFLIIV